MRARGISLMLLLFCMGSAIGQEKLDKIKAPSSPGASVIGIQPTTILTPKSYQALEANLFSNYLADDGSPLIPDNVGLEFSPYWMANPKMSAKSYLLPKPGQSLIRSLSVSVASTQNFKLGDSTNSNALGLGLRTNMYFPAKKYRDSIVFLLDTLMKAEELHVRILGYATEILLDTEKPVIGKKDFIDRFSVKVCLMNEELKFFKTKKLCETFMEDISVLLMEALPDVAYSLEYFEAYSTVVDHVLRQYFKSEKMYAAIINYRDARPGLNLDLAAAMALNFPNNSFDFSYVPNNSLWFTLSYNFDGKWAFLRLLGVLKYNWYDRKFYEQYFPGQKFFDNNLDYGLGLVLNVKRFSAELEMVGRQSKTIIEQSTDPSGVTTTRTRTENDFQYIANISYRISDGMIVTYSIGNRFEPVFSYSGTLVSALSLNFGFGGPTVKDIE